MDPRFINTPEDVEQRRSGLKERITQLEREWQAHEDNKTRARSTLKALGKIDMGKAEKAWELGAGAVGPNGERANVVQLAAQVGVSRDQLPKLVQAFVADQSVTEAETSQTIIDEAWAEACAEYDALPEPPEADDEPAAADVESPQE